MENKNNPLQVGDLVGINKEKIAPFKVLEIKGKRIVVSDEKTKKKNLPLKNVRPWEALQTTIARLKKKNKKKIDFREHDAVLLAERQKKIINGIRANLEYYPSDLQERLRTLPDDDPIWQKIAQIGLAKGLEDKKPLLWDIELNSPLRRIFNIPSVMSFHSKDKATGEDTFFDMIIGGKKEQEKFTFPDTWNKNYRGDFERVPTKEALAFFDTHGFERKIIQQAVIDARRSRSVFFVTAGFLQNVETAEQVTVQRLKEADFKMFEMVEPEGVFFVK